MVKEITFRKLRVYELLQYRKLMSKLDLMSREKIPEPKLSFFYKLLFFKEGLIGALLNKDRAYVIKSGMKVIGCSHLHKTFGRNYYMTSLIVDDNYRGQGLGQKFMDYILADLKRIGAKEFHVATFSDMKGAVNFYTKYSLERYDEVFTLKGSAKELKKKISQSKPGEIRFVSHSRFLKQAKPVPSELATIDYPNPNYYWFRRTKYFYRIVRTENSGASAYALVRLSKTGGAGLVCFVKQRKESKKNPALLDALFNNLSQLFEQYSIKDYYVRVISKQKPLFQKYHLKPICSLIRFRRKL